jgi:hypothetical protein
MSGHHRERRPGRRRRLAWIAGSLAVCGVLVGGTVALASPRPHSRTAEVVSSRKILASPNTKSASGAHKSASPEASASASTSAKASKSATASASSSSSSTSSGTSGGSLSADLSSTTLTLGESTSYLQSGYNELPEWTRIDTEAAPNGDVYVAWQASDGIHVTPLSESGQRTGSDIVVDGAREVGGLVALDDGFALLTRMADTQSNIWNETAAYLVRYSASGTRLWSTKLTGTSTDDTAPVLDGALRWDGTRFGAYFVIHGAGGPASGHFGDTLIYVGAGGSVEPAADGGWSWGCSHNEGIALWPISGRPFAAECYDDWRSGLFVATGIGAPDNAPVIQRAQCWAGYCGGILGGLVRSPSGRFATLFSSRGEASEELNPADSSGRGWSVTSVWNTHQVAVEFLNSTATEPTGSPVYLTDEPSTDHVNPRIAPYGAADYLVSWESVSDASCDAGTCTGSFSGTHIRVLNSSGSFLTSDLVIPEHIAGDIAVLPNGSLMWTGPAATPSYSGALSGSGPTTNELTVAILKG